MVLILWKKKFRYTRLYLKYHHKIHQKQEQKSDHGLLYEISFKKPDAIK